MTTDHTPPADRAALRDRIAEALDNAHRTHPCPVTGSQYWTGCYHPDGTSVSCHTNRRTDAVLAVLPPPADRAAILHDAADALGRMDYDTDSRDYGYDTYRDAWNGGVMDGADLLRRMADEAAATETGCWCGHSEVRHWTGATDMTFTDGCHDCRGWNGAHVYGQELPWLPDGDQPAAGARQDGDDRG